MPNGKYDFEYDEPLSMPLDTETALGALLAVDPEDDPADTNSAEEAPGEG